MYCRAQSKPERFGVAILSSLYEKVVISNKQIFIDGYPIIMIYSAILAGEALMYLLHYNHVTLTFSDGILDPY